MKEFFSLGQILNTLDIKEDAVVGEFGCGSGKFSLLLAERLKKGKVYGFDIQKEPLSVLDGNAKRQGLFNIETIHCDLEQDKGSGLNNDSLDLVLIPNLLFQVEDRVAVLKEAKRIIKKSGQIFVMDWKIGTFLSPKESISVNNVKNIAESIGLIFKKQVEAGAFHWGLVLTKSG